MADSNFPVYKGSKIFRRAVGVSILLVLISVLLTFIDKDFFSNTLISDISAPFYNILTTAALCYAAIQTRKHSTKASKAWVVLALAQLLYTLGDITWAILELGLHQSPFPSFADIGYLAFYPLFFAGAFLLPAKSIRSFEWIKRALDIAIVMVTAILAAWIFLIGPLLSQGMDIDPLTTVLSIAYPVGDLIMILALLVIAYGRNEKTPVVSIWLLFLGAFVMIVTDCTYSYQNLLGSYVAGGFVDLGWIISLAFTGLAGIHQAASSQKQEEDDLSRQDDPESHSISPSVLSYFPYFWVVLAYFVIYANQNNPIPGISIGNLYLAFGFLIALVLIRQIIALYENNLLLSNLKISFQQAYHQTAELNKTNTALRFEIIERKRIEQQLAHDALHDSLTGLANRVLFLDRLHLAIEHTRRDKSNVYSILFLDMDNFKKINDTLGHSGGDSTLIEVGKKLQACIRSIDTVARYGGDEFVILLEDTRDENSAQEIARRILEELEKPLVVKGNVINLSCSIGMVMNITNYANPEEVLRDVDIAMYQAKEKGKSRYEIFSMDMRTHTLDQLTLESDLRHALDDFQFVLHYQPFYALDDQRLVGLEALIRWNHPQRGLLLPVHFIPVAEKTGLIEQVGEWVLLEGCSQFRNWLMAFPELSDLELNVNISGKQIIGNNFIAKVKQALEVTHLDPHRLNLEITETVFVENQATFLKLLLDLQDTGIKFTIDDFGMGYSSLGYLKNLPVGTIKIDKSFIKDILSDEKDAEIVNTIIKMAHSLGLATIAEGIETVEQLAKVKSLQCNFGQGFLFSKGIDSQKVTELLKREAKRRNLQNTSDRQTFGNPISSKFSFKN